MSAVCTERPPAAATPEAEARRAWLVVAAAMFVIGWGGNQFTPLLLVYRERAGYSQVGVDVFLGAYVLGLVPGLLVASGLSDRFGRRPLMLVGLVASGVGSGMLAPGTTAGAAGIIAGRLLCGLGVGVAMAVGSSWVTELSGPRFDPAARSGTGARRASVALTLGLGVGPGVAGVLAQWAPLPLSLTYLLHLALVVPVLGLVALRGVETRFGSGPVALLHRLRVPAASSRRFRRVVLPMAPWIFGSAAVAYAIVPQVVHDRLGSWALLFTTVLTVATLGTGVLVQPFARRLDDVSTARAVFFGMVLMSAGLLLAALTAATRSPVLAAATAVLLGGAYGIAVVSGLLEVQRIAAPDELAGLTGVYYALAYIGFLLPALLAELSHWFGYGVMLTALGVLAVGCTAVIATSWSRHLPGRSVTV